MNERSAGICSREQAVRLHRSGRLAEAASAYQSLLHQSPADADLMQLLGVTLAQLGRNEQAVALLARSVELQPRRATVWLNLALALQAVRRPQESLNCCDRALALDGSSAKAYSVRGSALTALGRLQEALANHGQAARLAPDNAAVLTDLGLAFEAVERGIDAMTCLERAIALDPNNPIALLHHGICAARAGEHARALTSFDRAIALQPQAAALHTNRAIALTDLNRLPEALQSLEVALAIEPGHPQTLHNRAIVYSRLSRHSEALADYDQLRTLEVEQASDLIGRGAALLALQRPQEALEPLERAVALVPNDLDANIQYGVALLRSGRHEQAIAQFDRALGLRKDLPEVLNNRGAALVELNRNTEALQNFVGSAALDSLNPDTHINLGLLLRMHSRHREATVSFERALSMRPDDAKASFALAFTRLTLGDFERGWPAYESRFREPTLGPAPREFPIPRWDGRSSLLGKTLLVYAEQGLGDTIQFCRYLAPLQERGAAVIFEVMPQLMALMQSLPDGIQILPRGAALPRADYHCPLLSLPLALGTDLSSIPAAVPYLAAETERVANWRSRLQAMPGVRVGIAWQGNPAVEKLIWARGRSMPLRALAPLAAIEGVSLISLQKGYGCEQLRDVPFGPRIHDFTMELDLDGHAFVDTAALVQNLDLVITTDTSVAHLAGALARPTWTALPAVAEWRWLLGRDDSPWYPTMRLFRQPLAGDWDSVGQALGVALAALAVSG